MRFPRCLSFRRHGSQGGRFGDLLGAQFLVRKVGGTVLGSGPLARQPDQFFLFLGARSGRGCQFGSGEFTALGIRQGALFRLDSRAQGDFGEAFGMGLLRGDGLRRGLYGRAAARLFGGEIFGLLPALGGGNLRGGEQVARFGGGSGALLRGGAPERRRFRRPLGVGCVCRSEAAADGQIAALPLRLLQSLQ